ncbi:MAG: hypothetical protein JWP81_1721 [Ferruginibacter sp.]|nr:hypothetical protein [Ferruginibacter sp.]
MYTNYLLLLVILSVAIFYSVKMNKLTPGGAIAGGVIGCCIFAGAFFTGITMVGLFFLLGTLATSWKRDTKEKFGAAESNRGRRTAMQVIANGGIAALAGLLSSLFPIHQQIFQLAMASALAAATADTLSSELGMVYGKKFYNMLTFRSDRKGENGVVSLEGALIGVAGSALIAMVYSIGFGWGPSFIWIVIAGTAGNIADSLLGATLERKQYLTNDAVNLANTLTGALSALVLDRICR